MMVYDAAGSQCALKTAACGPSTFTSHNGATAYARPGPECACSNDTALANGRASFSDATTPPFSTASFTCDAGFQLAGANTSQCVANATHADWETPWPVCQGVRC